MPWRWWSFQVCFQVTYHPIFAKAIPLKLIRIWWTEFKGYEQTPLFVFPVQRSPWLRTSRIKMLIMTKTDLKRADCTERVEDWEVLCSNKHNWRIVVHLQLFDCVDTNLNTLTVCLTQTYSASILRTVTALNRDDGSFLHPHQRSNNLDETAACDDK